MVMRANPRRYMRYAQVQAKFLGWCRDHSVEPKQPSSLLNFLAYGHATLGLSFQTLANYRSSILDMFEEREAILSFWPLKTFFQAVQESTIRADRSRPVDIQPIIQHFHGLGPNHSMALLDLTTKLCWLLGVFGFMRPSDIERINLDESVCTTFSEKVILKVMAPKEKRLGQRTQKEIIIRQHDDPLLCPVAALKSYLSRHAHHPCRFPHPALPHVSIHYLLRDMRDCHRPVYRTANFQPHKICYVTPPNNQTKRTYSYSCSAVDSRSLGRRFGR